MHQICYLFLIWNITNTVVCEGIKICLTPSKWMTVKPWSRKTRSFDVSFGSLHRILLFYTMSDAFDIKKLVPCSELGPQRRFHMIQHKCLPLHFTFRSFKRVIRLLMDYCNTLLTFVFFFFNFSGFGSAESLWRYHSSCRECTAKDGVSGSNGLYGVVGNEDMTYARFHYDIKLNHRRNEVWIEFN